ncbi:hypothetical protein TKV_c07570 [Thermoanaerobacter kivui]|uniref:Uncharacterized protein n=1 Tax=Thermoanaerobacter kivui TaxID=2325 RepID=A0A097AQ44_THEKI|nr:hypothetical protein [Thermoanaerobacter kivui]AIS51940.1 hypothetical protein TKV_c07570 [Thermoanaerobacter kivui]
MYKNQDYLLKSLMVLLLAIIMIDIYKSTLMKDNAMFSNIMALWILFTSYIVYRKYNNSLTPKMGIIFVSIISITNLLCYLFPDINYSFAGEIIYHIVLLIGLGLLIYASYSDFKNVFNKK